MGLQVRVIDPQTASNTLEGPHLRSPSCGELVSTAKTTLLPATTITGAKKNKQRDRNTFCS